MATEEIQLSELSVADRLDNEIANLRDQVESLKRDLKLQTATIITSEPTRQLLQASDSTQRPKPAQKTTTPTPRSQELLAKAGEHDARKQQCLYRTCASITTFKVCDPDPRAADGGRVLGLRLEIMYKARFLRPYYVLLNRPHAAGSRALRVHRHTVPPCVPLAALAARHLPPPPAARDERDAPKKQDLAAFARALRRELVRYHNRTAAIGDLRSSAGLERKTGERERAREGEVPIVDISAADAQAKQIRVEWGDGRSGRLVIGDDGDIVKMVAQGENGQDRDAVRQLLGKSVRVEEVVRRLDAA
ncbi:Cenp-O kinetochore centromere component-domain-containing protein [Annulohypoxylon bovei var. microspora]|nr:Cenp-O kinetochore centromere component-domain-containing protein [Annulohypoxylon bovei var. microspora]